MMITVIICLAICKVAPNKFYLKFPDKKQFNYVLFLFKSQLQLYLIERYEDTKGQIHKFAVTETQDKRNRFPCSSPRGNTIGQYFQR